MSEEKREQIALPNKNEFTQSDSTGVDMVKKGISGRTVKELVLPEEHEYKTPSYLIDLRKIKMIHRLALSSLRALAQDKEDSTHTVPIYLYCKDKVVMLGYGEGYTLYSTLKKIIKLQFEANVYLNEGDGFKELDERNVFGLRLDL